MRKNNKLSNLSQNLSSNTLFHFTNSFERLTDILKNGFKISYVPEKLPKKNFFYIAPMVCFCDIPLGGVKVHLQRYGNYGIGIHKNFCRSKNINPVFYIDRHNTFDFILPEPLMNFASVIPYVKKYIGEDLKRNGKFKFYDECEWRYVEKDETKILWKNKDLVKKECSARNQNPNRYLKFELNAIEYIIVRYKKELAQMVDFIGKNIKVDEQEKKILYTKIITATRIKNDF